MIIKYTYVLSVFLIARIRNQCLIEKITHAQQGFTFLLEGLIHIPMKFKTCVVQKEKFRDL